MLKITTDKGVEEINVAAVTVDVSGISFHDAKQGFMRHVTFDKMFRFELAVDVTPKMKEASEIYQKKFSDKNPALRKVPTRG